MFISVVVPTYKRKEKLINTLESLSNQTYSKDKYEVLVVEDGLKETKEMVEKFSFKHLFQEKGGPAKARNLGVNKAKGEIIAFTDDDCVVPRNWLEKIVAGFDEYQEVVGVGGYLEADDETLKNNIYAKYERFISRRDYVIGDKEVVSGFENPAGGTNNMAYKKSVLAEIGGFDETFPVAAGEDADLKWRITAKGYGLLFIPLKVTHYQTYNFSSFLKQAFNRGMGSYYFERKWGKEPTKSNIYYRFFYLPFRLIKKLLTDRDKIMNLLDSIYLFQELRGELKLAK